MDVISWEQLDKAMREELYTRGALEGDNYTKRVLTSLRTILGGRGNVFSDEAEKPNKE